jgi:beta-N-acetylhexosaminidase
MVPAIFGLSGLTLNDEERAFFRDADPAGYILFGRNIQDREQLRALTDDLRAIHGRERLFICIDQEGGRVARMKPPVWPAYPPGEAFDRLYDLGPISAMEAARCNAQALGMDLAEVGITVALYPSLDLRHPGTHDVVGDRAFGAQPMQVAALGRSALDGLAQARVHATADELEQDLQPFRSLASTPIGMTAHVRYTAWDAENPATLSPFVVGEVIRGRIGFDGLLLTDDLDMQALQGSVPDLAAQALGAGCDLALNCWAKMDDMVGIARTCPDMPEATAARLDRALTRPEVMPADQAELAAKRDALLALAANAAQA